MMTLADSLGMINSAIQYAGAQIGAVKDKKWIEKENQKARDFQLEMWNKANEYNLPSAQMQRLKDAGLNPNLVYGQGTSTLADYVSSPGHSAPNMNSKDLSKYNMFEGYLQAQQLKMQQELVKSQISLNESQESKNIASAEESRSKIPSNISNNLYLNKLIQMQDNENAWYNISLPAKTAMLDLQQAIMAGNADMIVQQTKRLTQQTAIDKQMADLQTYAVNNSVELQWKHYNLSKQELGAKIELWLKEGDAAVRNSKANFLNALTNGKLASLKEKEFNKFSDAELDVLEQKATQLRTNNAWADMLNENEFRLGTKILEGKSYENQKQMLDLINYYNKMMMDFTGSIFSSSYKF